MTAGEFPTGTEVLEAAKKKVGTLQYGKVLVTVGGVEFRLKVHAGDVRVAEPTDTALKIQPRYLFKKGEFIA